MPPKHEFDPLEVLESRAQHIRELLDGLEMHGDGEHESTLRSVARLSVALTSICSEIRQNKKAATREIARIPLDQVVGYLKSLSMTQRESIARDITNADAEEPLL